jgi:hypothetical protein
MLKQFFSLPGCSGKTIDSANSMKKILFILFFSACYSLLFSQTGPDAILPSEKEVPGWRGAGEYKMYKEEDLKKLAGNDAELITEFGFKNVVSRNYFNFSGKEINVQVYTMDNTFGSYGLFLQKSRGEKVFKEFGNACFEKKGSFRFWKHIYFVVIQSESSGDTISQGFRQIAGIIDSKIKSKGVLPDILRFSGNRTGTTSLFRGPVALGNIYYFGPVNIFNINEGLAIENSDSRELIFKYTDNNEAVRRFSDAAGILGKMEKYSDFKLIDKYSFTMKDKEGKILTFKVDDICLDVIIK